MPRNRPLRRNFRFSLPWLISASLLAAPAAGEQSSSRIYRSVDEDGNVVFSDQPPRPGQQAEPVEVQSENTFTPPPGTDSAGATGAQQPEAAAAEDEAAPAYRSLRVASPADDEGLRDNAGNVTVTAALEPALAPGHSLQVYLDGQLRQTTQGPAAQLLNVDRGTHTLELRIVDAAGNTLISSSPSVFHLQRRSVINQPARAPRPGN